MMSMQKTPSSMSSKTDFLTRPVEELSDSVKEYADLRLDDLKLRTAKGLSLTLSRLLAMILVIFAFSIVLLSLAFGLALLLGKAIGSYAGGAFIVAGFFLLVTIVLVALRKRLFVDSFVKMFIGIFFDEKEEEEEA